ncbi:MAG: transcriptional repressor [Pirellulaceae bacterium]|jgi:Fur family peroxide stress response transcriptional regulator|nr:transcriptional repressor [Pirellulaceae bacterium]
MGESKAKILRRLEEACRARGLPLTAQRRIVLEELLRRTDHPTADQLFEAVRTLSPQIARRTVYRVLDTLAELGLVRRVHHPGAAVRYDAKTHRHHHLVCQRCNRIVDLENAELDRIPLPRGTWHGFTIADFSVQLIGLCPACRKLKKSIP